MPSIWNTFTFATAMIAASTQAGNTEDWKKRSVYQLLTDRFAKDNQDGNGCGNLSDYCGGTFKGIKNNLDYIQGMGFDAIWISPVVDNTDGGYHGYWARNWEQINGHFGSEQDLKDLVSACHARDIWVMVDVVANHVAPIGNDFGQIYPLNKSEHYHNDCGINDWNNQWEVENCRLAGLPDLAQENDYVQQYLKDWIRNLVQTYNFDGIRIDTIPEVPAWFWQAYGDASGVFQVGECFNGDPAYVGPYQNVLTSVFNYPMYYTIKDVFRNQQSMHKIKDRYDAEQSHFRDMRALGVFVDNHDNARFLSGMGDHKKLESATVFALTADGIPYTYYGTEQYFGGGNDPANRESIWNAMNTNSDLYQIIAKTNAARKRAEIWNYDWVQRYAQDDFLAFSRGQFLVALTNTSSGSHYAKVTYHPFNEGEIVCNIFQPTSDCQQVSGGIDVYLENGEQKIYVPQNQVGDDFRLMQ